MRGDRVFVDTNVLVYAHDVSARDKHEIAKEKIRELWESGSGIISTQVLQEFFVMVTERLPRPMPREAAREIISLLCRWELVVNDGESVLRAIELQGRYGFSFWDSLILDAAISSKADVLLTEDLSHGQTIQGVKITNPFP